MTRCKYVRQKVVKSRHWNRAEDRFLFEAEFAAVTDGSDENKKFFEFTPSGSLKVGTYREDIFVPGKEYYIDISEAPSKA